MEKRESHPSLRGPRSPPDTVLRHSPAATAGAAVSEAAGHAHVAGGQRSESSRQTKKKNCRGRLPITRWPPGSTVSQLGRNRSSKEFEIFLETCF